MVVAAVESALLKASAAYKLLCALMCAAPPSLSSQVIVAESYGGNDEPVDTLMANLVGVGAEVGVVGCMMGLHLG